MILVNGAAGDVLPAADRGLSYGDGVFRTLAVTGGQPVVWQRQYAKLRCDCRALQIACPPEAKLREDLLRIVSAAPECAVKIMITRGQSGRGYAVSRPPVSPTRIVMSFPLPEYPPEHSRSGVRIRCCVLQLGHQRALAGVKHLNRLENVLARLEWNEPDIAEGLLLDQDGNVISGTMSNLFIVQEGALATPDLSRCGVAGVTRERVLEVAAEHGLECRIVPIGLDCVRAAQEVFLVNSLIGVWPVRALDGHVWRPGPLTAAIRHWLDEKTV